MNSAPPIQDAVKGHWVDTHAPARFRPWLRLMRADRPIGTWLLLLPGWQAIALAAVQTGWTLHDLWLFIAFGLGAVLMRGAGCVFNDIVDRDFDGRVARTAARPIPSGQISVRGATLFMMALALISFGLLLSMNDLAIVLGVLSLLPVAIYPFMKRVTWWPQVFLGIAFNWGALLGWAAQTGTLDWPPVVLYLAGICWTLGYDTIYAHQDREDDALVGIKSTARLFGDETRRWLWRFYALAWLGAGLAIWLALGWGWWVLGVVGYGAHLIWQIRVLDINSPDTCLLLFRANRDSGLILLAAILLGMV